VSPRTRPTLAVVGPGGLVGAAVRALLSQREDIWGEIRLVDPGQAEDRSEADVQGRGRGRRLAVRGEQVPVRPLSEQVFAGVGVAVFDVPSALARKWAPLAASAGAVVVDGSAAFRTHSDVPLVVATVNPQDIEHRPRGIVASPGSTMLTMVDALAPLHARWELTDLVVTALLAASEAGQRGVDRLYDEIEAVSGDRSLGSRAGDVRRAVEDEMGTGARPSPFPAPLELNVIPWVGEVTALGWTTEEASVRDETRKVLSIADLKVSVTCVRVPVVTTHSLALHATFARDVDVAEVRRSLVLAPTVVVIDDAGRAEFPTPVDVVGAEPTFVGRIRRDLDFPNRVGLFVCGDNLYKGRALNLVQVAELVALGIQAPEG
jgi:aspartate-semialdehyde dehydrogenase